MDGATKRIKRWTGERIARLGLLIGAGWEAKRIAQDPIMATTVENVHRQAGRFGLEFRAAPHITSRLPDKSWEVFDKAAYKRGITREVLISRILTEIADEPYLLDNILDDGV